MLAVHDRPDDQAGTQDDQADGQNAGAGRKYIGLDAIKPGDVNQWGPGHEPKSPFGWGVEPVRGGRHPLARETVRPSPEGDQSASQS